MKAFLLALVLGMAIPAAAQATPKPRVRIDTSYGPFVVELEPELAPKTVANFLQYVHEGFYSDTIFHRVIDGFMIQGGGMTRDMVEKATHPPIVDEAQAAFKGGLMNTRGTIAMARTNNPDSAAAQFFINTNDNKDLNNAPGYCPFGRVVGDGMAVVDKIAKVHTIWYHGMQNVPEYPVRIKSIAQIMQPDQE